MSLPIQTIVGGNQSATAGSAPVNLRVGPTGELVLQELHGRYYETTVRKAMFSGANLAGVTTSAGFATTYTGCVLSNPLGSNVNLVLNKVSYGTLVAQTAALVLGLMKGYNAATAPSSLTALVPTSNMVGQPAGVGLLSSAATLPTAPTSITMLDTLTTGAITVSAQAGKVVDLEGGMVIPPGGYVAFYTSAASVASSLVFGMQWEEVSATI